MELLIRLKTSYLYIVICFNQSNESDFRTSLKVPSMNDFHKNIG